MGLRDIQALAQERARAEAKAARLRTAEAKARRAADTRAKVIVGAIALSEARHDPAFRAVLVALLEARELRQSDVIALNAVLGEGWHHGV